MPCRSLRTVLLLVGIVLILSGCASIGGYRWISPRGVLYGTVRDSTGATVARGCPVRLAEVRTHKFQTARTNRYGRYGFRNLPPGEYALGVSRNDGSTSFAQIINLQGGDTLRFDVNLGAPRDGPLHFRPMMWKTVPIPDIDTTQKSTMPTR